MVNLFIIALIITVLISKRVGNYQRGWGPVGANELLFYYDTKRSSQYLSILVLSLKFSSWELLTYSMCNQDISFKVLF